jgi:hypothetical protein
MIRRIIDLNNFLVSNFLANHKGSGLRAFLEVQLLEELIEFQSSLLLSHFCLLTLLAVSDNVDIEASLRSRPPSMLLVECQTKLIVPVRHVHCRSGRSHQIVDDRVTLNHEVGQASFSLAIESQLIITYFNHLVRHQTLAIVIELESTHPVEDVTNFDLRRRDSIESTLALIENTYFVISGELNLTTGGSHDFSDHKVTISVMEMENHIFEV